MNHNIEGFFVKKKKTEKGEKREKLEVMEESTTSKYLFSKQEVILYL